MTDQSKTEGSNQPVFRACTVKQWSKEGESYWTRIGVAFKRPGNKLGYVVKFDAHPTGDVMFLLPMKEDDAS